MGSNPAGVRQDNGGQCHSNTASRGALQWQLQQRLACFSRVPTGQPPPRAPQPHRTPEPTPPTLPLKIAEITRSTVSHRKVLHRWKRQPHTRTGVGAVFAAARATGHAPTHVAPASGSPPEEADEQQEGLWRYEEGKEDDSRAHAQEEVAEERYRRHGWRARRVHAPTADSPAADESKAQRARGNGPSSCVRPTCVALCTVAAPAARLHMPRASHS